MALQIFQEDYDSSEELTEETKGNAGVTISNGLSLNVEVEIPPFKLVRKTNIKEKTFGVGGGLDLSAHVQVGTGATNLECYDTQVRRHTMGPHSIWKVPVESSSLASWRPGKAGKAAQVENSMQIHFFLDTSATGGPKHQEINSGYTVGPGHGLIIYQTPSGQYQVEQTKGRAWYRKFDPWTNNQGYSRDPHIEMRRMTKCPGCNILKR